MLSVLFTGMLTSEPEQREDRRGKAVTTFRLTAIDAEGRVVKISAIGFSRNVAADLAGLTCGDEVAIAGHASLSTWKKGEEQQFGLDVKVTRVLTMRDAGHHLTPAERAQLSEPSGG